MSVSIVFDAKHYPEHEEVLVEDGRGQVQLCRISVAMATMSGHS